MRRVRLFGAGIMALAIVGLTASQLFAADEPENKGQPERPANRFMQRAGGLELLQATVVADDLKLTDDQKESIKKLSDDSRAKMREMRSSLQGASREEIAEKMAPVRKELDKKVDGILDAKQQARFKEIKLQALGAFALAEDSVQDTLKVTEDQEASLKKIMDQFDKDARSARGEAGSDRASAFQKMRDLAKDAKDKLLAALTSDQRDQFDKMQGKKLDLSSVHFGSQGGFGRRQRKADSGNSENKSDNKSDSKSDNKSDSK